MRETHRTQPTLTEPWLDLPHAKELKANLQGIKGMGVRDAVYHKKRGLDELDMAKSHWVFKQLRIMGENNRVEIAPIRTGTSSSDGPG